MKIKLKIIIFLFFSIKIFSLAQQDPEAKNILDKVAQKTKSYKSIKTEFFVNINDRKTKKNVSFNGKLFLKGDKYRYETEDNIIYFDGKNIYNYYKEENEVSISDFDPQDNDLLNNPIKIINVYNKDFKYRYNGISKLNNKNVVHEIDLFPNNLKQSYTRIKIYVDTTNLYLSKFIISGKDGVDVIVTFEKFEINTDIPDNFFTIPENILKKAEVIDLRRK